jgi:hypothetical protein
MHSVLELQNAMQIYANDRGHYHIHINNGRMVMEDGQRYLGIPVRRAQQLHA